VPPKKILQQQRPELRSAIVWEGWEERRQNLDEALGKHPAVKVLQWHTGGAPQLRDSSLSPLTISFGSKFFGFFGIGRSRATWGHRLFKNF
jgi:hypothetical protein